MMWALRTSDRAWSIVTVYGIEVFGLCSCLTNLLRIVMTFFFRSTSSTCSQQPHQSSSQFQLDTNGLLMEGLGPSIRLRIDFQSGAWS